MSIIFLIAIVLFIIFVAGVSSTPAAPSAPKDPSAAERRQRGIDTEKRAAEALHATAPGGWWTQPQVMRERGGDFDVVLHGPQRQRAVVEVKSHRGRPRLEGGHFFFGSDERDYVLAQVQDQALESGAPVIVWQPLARYGEARIGNIVFVSGENPQVVWENATCAS